MVICKSTRSNWMTLPLLWRISGSLQLAGWTPVLLWVAMYAVSRWFWLKRSKSMTCSRLDDEIFDAFELPWVASCFYASTTWKFDKVYCLTHTGDHVLPFRALLSVRSWLCNIIIGLFYLILFVCNFLIGTGAKAFMWSFLQRDWEPAWWPRLNWVLI